jgi:hypothetical protein
VFPFGEQVRQGVDHNPDLKKKDLEFAGVQAATEISETSKSGLCSKLRHVCPGGRKMYRQHGKVSH